MMVKAVQKFHDKINAPGPMIVRGDRERLAERPKGSCYQECILIITSDNDFTERFRGKRRGRFQQRTSLDVSHNLLNSSFQNTESNKKAFVLFSLGAWWDITQPKRTFSPHQVFGSTLDAA